MLRKTLKYDLNAVYKIWLILTVTVLAISFVGGLSLRDIIVSSGEEQFDAFTLFSTFGLIVTIFSIAAYILIVELLVLYRYYQNFFTDEAYLTFTLPVKRRTLFNSKLINAFIWSVANIAVVTAAVLIIMAFAPLNEDGTGSLLLFIFDSLFKTIGQIFELFDAWAYLYTLEALLIALFSTVFSTLLIYACITLGCTMVKKYKLLMAILVYYMVNMAISIMSYVGSIVMSIVTAMSIEILATYTEGQIKAIVFFTLMAIAAFYLVLCVVAYKFSLSRIEKNLNLA